MKSKHFGLGISLLTFGSLSAMALGSTHAVTTLEDYGTSKEEIIQVVSESKETKENKEVYIEVAEHKSPEKVELELAKADKDKIEEVAKVEKVEVEETSKVVEIVPAARSNQVVIQEQPVAEVAEVTEEAKVAVEETVVELASVGTEEVTESVKTEVETEEVTESVKTEKVTEPVVEEKVVEETEIALEEKEGQLSLSSLDTYEEVEVETETELSAGLVEETEVAEETEAAELEEPAVEEVVQEETYEEAESHTVYLSGRVVSALNVREGKGTSTQIIGVLSEGELVEGEASDGWIKISYNGVVGYISESLVNTTEALMPEEVYEEPVQEEVYEEEVYEEEVYEEEVYEEEVYEEAPVSGNAIDDIVSAAYSFVGGSYVFGGSSPSTGFDCSGLTSYLYRTYAGVELSRVTTGQAGNGYEVGVANIQPGDLILFQNDWSDHIDHVGIYVGGGSYVHASSEERGIALDSTSGSYFQNNVVSVRRILN